MIGNPLDTTIALQKLIFEGVFDRFPQLKVLGAHGGGFLGSYAPRMDRSCFVSPQNCNPDIVLQKKPSEYLRQIYFDALVFTGIYTLSVSALLYLLQNSIVAAFSATAPQHLRRADGGA